MNDDDETIQKQNHFLQTLLDAIPIAVYYTDANGVYVGCNTAFENLRNVKREDIIGASPIDASPLKTAYFHKQIDDNLLESTDFQTQYEKEMVTSDGQVKNIIYQKSVLTTKAGKKIGIVGAMLDITQRKKQELEIEETKQRYKRLIEVSPFATILHENGNIEFANNAAVRMLRACTREDLLGRKYLDFVHPKFRAQELQRMEEMKKERGYEVPLVESQFLTYTGELIDVETAATSFERVNGNMVFEVVFHDIAERKKAEKALHDNRKLLSTTLHSIGDGVISTDNSGQIIGVNAAAESILGYKEFEMIGKPLNIFIKFIHQFTKKEVPNPVEMVLNTGALIAPRNNTLYVTSSGKEVPIKHNASPIIDEYGDMIGVVMVFRDVSEEYQHQEKLLRSERLAAVGLMASGIAHEFNNINAVIKGHVDLIYRETVPDKVRKSLDIVKSALSQGASITNDLLAFTSTASNKGSMKAVQPKALIQGVVELLNIDLGKENVKVDIVENTTAKIYVQPKGIAHVLMNMIINAQHAMTKSQNKQITITIEEPPEGNDILYEDKIILKIADVGCGIAKDNLSKIFMPFFSTKGNFAEKNSWQANLKGTGLGLSVCHAIIVGQHKGEIKVDTEVNKGTTFSLYLPKYIDQSQTGYVNTDYEKGNGERILLLGGALDTGKLLWEAITGEGYKVFISGSIQEAITEHIKDPFAVVIADARSNFMDGEFTKEVSDSFDAVKIVLTNKIWKVPIADVYYPKKPYDLVDLMVHIYSGLKKRRERKV
jgi:PAS domain S-box-containing protein